MFEQTKRLNTQVEKSPLHWKIVIRKKWFDFIAFVYKWLETSFMAYHPSYKQMGHFMGRETVYCTLNNNMVEGVGCPVLCARQRHWPWNSLPMSRLCGGSPKLMRWECKRIQKEILFNRLARVWKKYPRCQPPDFCYQLCTPKGVHNKMWTSLSLVA